MEFANTLGYYDTATITVVKSCIVQAPGTQRLIRNEPQWWPHISAPRQSARRHSTECHPA